MKFSGNRNNTIFNKPIIAIYNNLTVSASSDVIPFGTNTGTGNINNSSASNLFVGGMSATVGYPTITTSDWHILAASPAHNTGTDGSDLGIYGGTQPMINLTGASNLIPQMTLLNISNPSLPVNDNLNVRFKARKQD